MNALTTACPSCGARFRVAPKSVGRHAKCRRCETAFVVRPAVGPAASDDDRTRMKSDSTNVGRPIREPVNRSLHLPRARHLPAPRPSDGGGMLFGDHIARVSRNTLCVHSAICFAITLLVGANWRYWENWCWGPYAVSLAQLATELDPAGRRQYYCTIHADAVHDTGVQQITRRKHNGNIVGEHVSANFVLAQQGQHLLLVKSEPKHAGSGFYTGELMPLPQDEGALALDRLVEAGDRAAVIPAMLDEGDIVVNGRVLLTVLGVIFAYCAVKSGAGICWIIAPRLHPAHRRLARYGGADQLEQRLDRELATALLVRYRDCLVTPNWLLVARVFRLIALPIQEIVWAYGRQVKTYQNGCLMGTKHFVCVHLSDGLCVDFKVDEKNCELILARVVERAPWVLIGFDDGLRRMWKKQRCEVIAAVERQRRVMLSTVDDGS